MFPGYRCFYNETGYNPPAAEESRQYSSGVSTNVIRTFESFQECSSYRYRNSDLAFYTL